MKQTIITLLCTLTYVVTHAADQRPNIIFSLADVHRYDALSCMDHPFVKTPHNYQSFDFSEVHGTGSSTIFVPAEMWYEDNNQARSGGIPRDFKEKFVKPETWARAREVMDVYMIRANSLDSRENAIDEEFIREKMAPVLKAANLPVAIDFGGATWRNAGRKQNMLQRELNLVGIILEAGIQIRCGSLQSVLSKPLFDENSGKRILYPMDKRYQDVLDYFQAFKKQFPGLAIGIIDALPTHDDDYETAYCGLKEKLARYGFKLDHILLDIPFELPEENRLNNSWPKVKAVERYVKHEVGCRFGLIGASKTAGHESDRAYHRALLKMLDRCRTHRIEPDFFIMMSWFPHPKRSIPDNAPEGEYPAMKTFVEFADKYKTTAKEKENE